jgi:hypothetical protein
MFGGGDAVTSTKLISHRHYVNGIVLCHMNVRGQKAVRAAVNQLIDQRSFGVRN